MGRRTAVLLAQSLASSPDPPEKLCESYQAVLHLARGLIFFHYTSRVSIFG